MPGIDIFSDQDLHNIQNNNTPHLVIHLKQLGPLATSVQLHEFLRALIFGTTRSCPHIRVLEGYAQMVYTLRTIRNEILPQINRHGQLFVLAVAAAQAAGGPPPQPAGQLLELFMKLKTQGIVLREMRKFITGTCRGAVPTRAINLGISLVASCSKVLQGLQIVAVFLAGLQNLINEIDELLGTNMQF